MGGTRAVRGLARTLSLAGLFAASLPATSAGALTIEEALAEAARSNPTVLAAREQARAAHEGVPVAQAAWLPTVQASAGTRVSEQSTESPPFNAGGFSIPSSRTDSSEQRSIELSYTQNIYRSGGDTALLRQAGQQVLQGNARVAQVEQDILLQVATVYLDVIRARRAVDLRVAALAAFEERLRQTEAQYQVGDSTNADIAQAQAEREVAAAELSGAEADLEVQRALFEALVGFPAEGLDAAGEPDGLPATLDEARMLAARDRPAVRAAEHAVQAAEQGVRAVWGDVGPRVDLQGSMAQIRYEDQNSSGFPPPIRAEDRSFSVQVRVPLYQGGGATSRLRQQRRVLAQTKNERLAAAREAEQRATSAWRNLGAHRRTRDALAVAVEASQAALDGIRREADIGERTVREVLDAERDLVSRQVSVLSAERDVVVAGYQLLEAVGGLTARRLGIGGVPDLGAEARKTGDSLLLPEPFE